MSTQTFYHTALVLHIIGLSMLAGTTLADYILTKQLWKQYETDKSKGLAINQVRAKFALMFGIGFLLLIISGVTMMGITSGVFGEMLWFRIKFGLLILIIINGLTVGRRQSTKLRKLLSAEAAGTNVDAQLLKVKVNTSWFHVSQMVIFIIIFVLSVFKFA